jgi:dolichyl-phosphate-mannose-protein mannosyltransferase
MAENQLASPAPTGAPTPDVTAPARLPRPRRPAERALRSPWAVTGLIAAAAAAGEMAVSTRYGYHRDELYFLQAGHHLAAGYVDQPPLTPLAARLATELFGGSLAGLRLLPALALGVLVLITAAMSRTLGAGRVGQAVAALATATCGEYLGAMHLLTTTVLDFTGWSLALLFFLRLLASGNPRWWLAIGGSAGLAAADKWTISVLAVALVAALAVTPQRALLRSRYLLLGCLLAAALGAPDVVWQASHGWPNLAVFHALSTQAGHNRIVYWPAQALYTGLALTPVWVAGLVWCLRNPAARRFRPAGVAAVTVVVVFFLLGGKPYYPGAVFTFLFAAGAVPVERWLAGGGARRGATAAAVLVLSTTGGALVALPVLPAGVLHTVPLQKINYDLAETIGWQQQVALVSREYRALPPGQRASTTILTGNYGEAGALARYGPAAGLPTAYSGANNFWYWGPPPARDRSAIAVNLDPALLHRLFTSVRRVAVFHNGLGVDDDEQGAAIYLATGLRGSWASAWPQLKDFS